MNAKIIKKKVTIELPETLETDQSARLFCEKPYKVERVEDDNSIVWFGYSKNWRYFKNEKLWYDHNDNLTEKPKYEDIYQELINKSAEIRKIKIQNIL